MQIYLESLFEKSGIYFITDATKSHVRIGESANIAGRLGDHISSRGKENTILLYYLECSNSLQEERAAHNHFMKYKLPGETTSFYSPEIIPLLENYVQQRGLKITQTSEKLRTGARTKLTDVWGKEVYLNDTRPKCHFFKEHYATIMGNAGTGEIYRTYSYKGVRVAVSAKFHRNYMNIKRIARDDADMDYLIELAAGYQNPQTANTSSSLNQFIANEESKLEQFYE